MDRRWKLARLYARRVDCDQAARDVGISSKTAGQVYAGFRTVLRFSDGEHWHHAHPFRWFTDQRGSAGEDLILEALFQNLFSPRTPAADQSVEIERPAKGH